MRTDSKFDVLIKKRLLAYLLLLLVSTNCFAWTMQETEQYIITKYKIGEYEKIERIQKKIDKILLTTFFATMTIWAFSNNRNTDFRGISGITFMTLTMWRLSF